MALARPVVNDLVAWLNFPSAPSAAACVQLSQSLAAAIAVIESRVDNAFIIAQGDGDLTSGTTYPQKVFTAIMILASRYNKRPGAPQGTAGFGVDGAVMRLLSTDPDVEVLISRYLKVDGFS